MTICLIENYEDNFEYYKQIKIKKSIYILIS